VSTLYLTLIQDIDFQKASEKLTEVESIDMVTDWFKVCKLAERA
jgi:hypothetical protein